MHQSFTQPDGVKLFRKPRAQDEYQWVNHMILIWAFYVLLYNILKEYYHILSRQLTDFANDDKLKLYENNRGRVLWLFPLIDAVTELIELHIMWIPYGVINAQNQLQQTS